MYSQATAQERRTGENQAYPERLFLEKLDVGLMQLLGIVTYPGPVAQKTYVVPGQWTAQEGRSASKKYKVVKKITFKARYCS